MVIVKVTKGPRCVVGCRRQLDKSKTTLTIMRAVASQLDCNFLKVVSSSIVVRYIGESARLIREMFNYARDHQPCIIFMDEIDAIDQRAGGTEERSTSPSGAVGETSFGSSASVASVVSVGVSAQHWAMHALSSGTERNIPSGVQ
ncbi:hypothetical protein AAFF_G00384820 [Aldrovandia affinis]|uniref:ATPase AAA-type core domain-containing protein n=1 Tax=Aldrovandia affinis TaxID=143900 RepID=A0AAD7R449_9TELE|nr:hypothetical protein AAFF_G00384820 [Aldrovandia affinis]